MSGEIITLQFGHRSNFVGTHYWNIQDAFASQYPDADVDAKTLFREEQEKKRGSSAKTIYSPRTLIFDLKGSLGAMGTAGYKTKKLHAGPNPSWNSKVDVVARQHHKNRFLRAVDDAYEQQAYDEIQASKSNSSSGSQTGAAALLARLTGRSMHQEEPGEDVSNPLERKRRKLVDLKEQEDMARRIYELDKSEGQDTYASLTELESLQTQIRDLEYDIRRLDLLSKERAGEKVAETDKYDFGLDDSVEVWSDFCKVNVHPNSLCVVDSFDHEFDAFDLWSQAAAAMTPSQVEDYMDTNLRYFAEECDRFRGFHVFVDAAHAWGGICNSFLDDIRQEYSKKSIFTFADVQQPVPPASKQVMEKNFSLASNYRDSVERALLNTSLSVNSLRSKSDTFVPYSCSHLSERFSHLSLDVKKRFHTSAMIASAIDNITMQYRFSEGVNSMNGLLSTVSPVPSLNIAALSLSAPLPLQLEKTALVDILNRDSPLFRADFMTPLLGSLSTASKNPLRTPFAESAFIRGIPEWARKSQSDPRMDAPATPTVLLMLQYMSLYACNRRNFMSMDEASPAPISFPRFFKPYLDRQGFIDAVPNPQESEQYLVRSYPSLTHLQSTTNLRGWYQTMGRSLSQLDWHRVAPLYDGELDKQRVEELSNEWATLSEDYEWHA